MSKKAEYILNRFKSLASEKQPFNNLYWRIGNYCLPNSNDFDTLFSPGENRQIQILDDTGQRSCDIFASSIMGLIANPATRWFRVEAEEEQANRDKNFATIAEENGQILLNFINSARSMFYAELKKALLQTGAYGLPIIIVEEVPLELGGGFRFKNIPVFEALIAESNNGFVDTLMGKRIKTVRQLMQYKEIDDRWDIHPEVIKLAKDSPDKAIECVYAYMPRADSERQPGSIAAKDKVFAGYWVDMAHKHIMFETGYDESPFAAARWEVAGRELYSRGAAMQAYGDMVSANILLRQIMEGTELSVQPCVFMPMGANNEKIEIRPRQINFYDATQGTPVFINGNMDINAAYTLLQQLQNNIKSAFYVDQLQMASDADMTATEVLQRTDEKSRLLAPSIGRIQAELLSPILGRCYNILERQGFIKPLPNVAQGSLKITFATPITRAQRQEDAQNILMFIQEAMQAAQANPEILDVIDFDKAIEELMDIRGITGMVKRDKKDVDRIRNGRKQQQQATMAMQAANSAADTAQKANNAGLL